MKKSYSNKGGGGRDKAGQQSRREGSLEPTGGDRSGEGPVARLFRWAILSHLDAVDKEHIKEGATSDSRIMINMFVSCLVLWIMNYLVLDLQNQRVAAEWLISTFGLWGGDPAVVTSNEMRLTMRISWSLGCSFMYLVIPGLVFRFVFKRRLRDLGLNPKGFFRHLWIYALLFLPVGVSVWFVSFQQGFQQTYPFYRDPASLAHLALWELFYGVQFFSLEFFFRGFMLSELKHRIGWRSILVMVIPYTMIHFTKPSLEALGAVIAGSVLGVLALRTRNIWGGVVIHVAVAWLMDIMSLYQRGWFGKV